jgi:hypothetical protein
LDLELKSERKIDDFLSDNSRDAQGVGILVEISSEEESTPVTTAELEDIVEIGLRTDGRYTPREIKDDDRTRVTLKCNR